MSSIVFYFPYRDVGGVSVLFLRMAKKLVAIKDVYIMDLQDGYMASNLPSGVRFIPFNCPEKIPSDALVVFQCVPPWRIENLFSFPRTARILFWNLHPYNLNPMLFQKGSHLEKLKWFFGVGNFLLSYFRVLKLLKTCKLLSSKESLVFMDEENWANTSRGISFNLPKCFLPITTEDIQALNFSPNPPKFGERVRIAWIGRLEDFKIPILMHTLSRLDEITSLAIDFEIIGDGASKNIVEDHANKLKNLSVNFKGYVKHTELEQEIKQHHVIFAMGTSALDSARLGLPTICLDFSYKPISGLYKYRLLRHCNGYNVGEEIASEHLEHKSTLELMLQALLVNYQSESELTLCYWQKHHSPDFVLRLFMKYAEHANATFDDLISYELHKPDLITKIICMCDPRKVTSNGFVLR